MKNRTTRRLAVLLSLSAALAAASYGAWYWYDDYHRRPDLQLMGRLVDRVPMKKKLIALTFDDGPSPANTRNLLALLARRHVHATFFMIGRHIEQYPEIARAVLAGGHQIGNHTYSHRHMVWQTPGFTAREIDRTDALIRRLGYEKEILFRSPYGEKFLILPYELRKRGKTNVTWDIGTNDWATQEVDKLVEPATTWGGPGSIILFHDGNEEADPERPGTLEAVERTIGKREADGYKFVTMDELIAAGAAEKKSAN